MEHLSVQASPLGGQWTLVAHWSVKLWVSTNCHKPPVDLMPTQVSTAAGSSGQGSEAAPLA